MGLVSLLHSNMQDGLELTGRGIEWIQQLQYQVDGKPGTCVGAAGVCNS
jgi:hypothetical protein